MEIRTRTIGQVFVLDIVGRLALSESGSDKVLENTVADLLEEGQRRFVFNLTQVSDVDTSGLTALVSTHLAVSRAGGKLTMVGPTPRLRHVLHVTRLDALFDLVESEDDAVATL